MIGVIASPQDEAVVLELFELFKTPFELARPDGQYEVLICCQPQLPPLKAKLVLWFGTAEGGGPLTRLARGQGRVAVGSDLLPLYGESVSFEGAAFAGLKEATSGNAAVVVYAAAPVPVLRIGYDLLGEIRILLTVGQPAEAAASPTLELHIALLRRLITAAGFPVVEIPAVPAGYRFMACLTHDVDHPILRKHRFDHTLAGFLYRSTLGSVWARCKGRAGWRQMMRNFAAAFSVPLVHLGIWPDWWRASLVAYGTLDHGKGSTFFVIPFKGRPGLPWNGKVYPKRASTYAPADIANELNELRAGGCEVGVHGLDAWCDQELGQRERGAMAALTNGSEIGVRMHWLFFDGNSPAVLEAAGYSYDSTVGFNQTVGFRAGTAQAFRPLNASRLLELPLLVMDTSMFYPSYLGLDVTAAQPLVRALLECTGRFGGAFTINWHDRSVAPERQWDGFYRWMLAELQERGAWFPTAGQAVNWFRQRRAVTFESARWEAGQVLLRLRGVAAGAGPALQLRVHAPLATPGAVPRHFDLPVGNGDLAIAV